MSELADFLSYDFLRHALVAGMLAAVLCGVVGTLVVVKRLVFLAGGISHAAFGGLGVCFFLGLDPRLGAAAVAVLAALLLAGVEEGRGGSRDATLGILWAVGMAVGITFLARTPGYAPNLLAYLFGNVLAVSGSDVVWTALLVAVTLALLGLFFEELTAVAFDADFARLQGVPVRGFASLLLVLVALSVVFLIQLVGIILVIALLTIPPLVGLRLARGLPAVMAVATAFGLAMTVGGLALSYTFDLPAGPAMVLLGAAGLLALLAGRWWRGRRWRRVEPRSL